MELKRISKGLVNRFSTLEKYERIIRSYYAYYGDDGTDPFFTTPIEKVNTPDKPLTVHLSRKIICQERSWLFLPAARAETPGNHFRIWRKNSGQIILLPN